MDPPRLIQSKDKSSLLFFWPKSGATINLPHRQSQNRGGQEHRHRHRNPRNKREAKKDDLKRGQNQSGRLLHRIRTGRPRRRNPISGALRRFLGQAAAAAAPHKGTGEPEGERKKRRRIRHAPFSSGDLKRCRRAVANGGEEKRGGVVGGCNLYEPNYVTDWVFYFRCPISPNPIPLASLYNAVIGFR